MSWNEYLYKLNQLPSTNQTKVTNPIHTQKSKTVLNKENISSTNSEHSYPNSYESKTANAAITSFGKLLVKQQFKPAKTKEELLEQIKNTPWLDKKFEHDYINWDLLDKQEDYENISFIWHELDKLSPILQNKIRPYYLVDCYYNRKVTGESNKIKNFSVEKINKLDNKLQEQLSDKLALKILEPIDNPETINEFFHAVDDKYKKSIFTDYTYCIKTKDKTKEYTEKTKLFQKLDTNITKKITLGSTLISPLHCEHFSKQVDYLNSLPQEEKDKLSKDYLQEIFAKSYSYALENENYQAICGTKDFKPFNQKELLKKELATLKNDKNEWIFSNEDINKIINNENDIAELSKILHGFKTNKFDFAYPYLKEILTNEGITFKDVQAGLELAKYIQESPEFKEIKDKLLKNSSVFKVTKETAENIKNNAYLIGEIKTHFPKDFERELRWHCTNILEVLKNSKIKPEVFKELMSQNIFPDKLELHQLTNIVKDDAINNIQPQNIKFLKDLKNNPVTSFLFTEPVYNLSNYNIPKILTMKLPADFELANQKQALKLISYINNDKGKRKVIGSFNAMANVQLLVKNDDFEQGKKLVDFIVENELCSCNSSKFLLRNSFEKNLNILKQIQNIEILNDKRKDGSLDPDNYYDAIAYPIEIVEKQLELIEYANQKSAFEGMYLNTWGCKGEVERQEAGVDPSNPEEIKKNIDKLAKISELMTPKLWGKVRSDALAKTLNNDKMANVNFKKENIEYFNKLISDERIEKIFNIYSSELINWLQQDLDCDSLFANYEDMLKFAEKYKDEIDINNLITFTGDIKKLEQVYEKLKKENPKEKVWVEIETATNNINFSTDNKEYIYDKNLNLLTSSVINQKQKQKKDGEIQTVTTFEDKQKNITNTITYKKDAIYEYPVPTHIVTKYSDKANNLIKTKIYDESSLDGVYNIKELYPNGKIKTISTGYQNSDGEFFEKNIESLDGTQSHILYNKDNSGNENYEYHIIDKEGNELLNLKRTTEFIDENTKVTTVNDKKYKVIYSENTIKILDINNNKETNINLEELNPDNDSVLKDMLKSLSGDELINLQKYVKKLELTARIQSSINPVSKTMYIGPHKFIFEHELGHAKDEINATVNEIANLKNIDDLERKITKDPQLQAIFEMEKNLLKEKLPKEILKEANYFINDTNHYGGKLGGLAETIAEINAIQTTPKFHPLLIMRTEILQEYFPKTIAYLINNSL